MPTVLWRKSRNNIFTVCGAKKPLFSKKSVFPGGTQAFSYDLSKLERGTMFLLSYSILSPVLSVLVISIREFSTGIIPTFVV